MANHYSFRRNGMTPDILVIDKEEPPVELQMSCVVQSAASLYVPEIECSRIRRTRRVVIECSDRAPALGTVHRQREGRLYLRPDHEYGQGFTDVQLQGTIYPLEAFPVLVFRWMARVQQEIEEAKG